MKKANKSMLAKSAQSQEKAEFLFLFSKISTWKWKQSFQKHSTKQWKNITLLQESFFF